MRRAALFIDFDNFFGGLLSADPAAALGAVENPAAWIHALRGPRDAPVRRWLLLRCYLNPNGAVDDPREVGRRLYFSKFRPFFTQAGVEVVDVPSLTRGAKNGADIRIAVDAMTALQAETRFDEIIIASSDADFTPLLQVVRAHDRRITVIATSITAPAYESLADEVLDEDAVFALVAGKSAEAETGDVDSTDAVAEIADAEDPSSGPLTDVDDAAGVFADLVRTRFSEADEPLNLAFLSTQLVNELGPIATRSHWFGSGGFSAALRRLDLPNAELSQYHLWDTSRHVAPPLPAKPSARVLPGTIARVATVTGLPRIASASWPVVYSALEAYRVTHEFNFSQATKWARDHAAEEGVEISREAFSYAVRACRNTGSPLTAEPSPDAETIGRAVQTSVLQQADVAGLDLSEAERAELAAWLHVEPEPTD